MTALVRTALRVPDLDVPWRQVDYCVVDVETTGLDLRHDTLVSFGSVLVRSGRIVLRSRVDIDIRPDRRIGVSAMTVHGLRHEDLGALSCLVFEVQDSGIGMSPAELAKLFDAFSQIDSELGRRHTGSGLGLTITRRLARKLGGDIQVHSEVGAGTAFMIRLPVRYQRASESTTWGRSLAAAIEKSSSSLRIGDLQR